MKKTSVDLIIFEIVIGVLSAFILFNVDAPQFFAMLANLLLWETMLYKSEQSMLGILVGVVLSTLFIQTVVGFITFVGFPSLPTILLANTSIIALVALSVQFCRREIKSDYKAPETQINEQCVDDAPVEYSTEQLNPAKTYIWDKASNSWIDCDLLR